MRLVEQWAHDLRHAGKGLWRARAFTGNEDSARHLQFLHDVVTRLEAAPGVQRATPVNTPPFPETGWDLPTFTAEGQSVEQAEANPSLNLEAVHPGYFATLGVTVVRGRGFAAADRWDSPRVAIVSEDVARTTWPGEDPIGKRLKFGGVDSEEPWRTVVGAFALAALLLSAVGLYAVVGAHVRERFAEIGVRVALGATPSDVRRLVLGEGLRLAGLGAALGLGAAVAAARVLEGLLFEVRPLDPVSLLGAALLLVGASGLAAYLPARRATRVDPLAVLRTM